MVRRPSRFVGAGAPYFAELIPGERHTRLGYHRTAISAGAFQPPKDIRLAPKGIVAHEDYS